MGRAQTVGPVRARLGQVGAAVGEGAGRYRRLLGRRDTALLLAAGIVSDVGDWFNAVALIAVSYEYGDGALGVGGMLALRMVPRLLFQGPAGVLVDRWPGRRLLAVSHVLMAAIAAAFVSLVAVPDLWLLYGLVLMLETVNTVATPAFRVQLMRETPAEHVAGVNGLLTVGMTAALFVGPLLGGFVLAAFGPAPVFLINGLTYLGVAVVVLRFRGRPADQPRSGDAALDAPTTDQPSPAEAAADAVAGGYRWLMRQTDLALFAGAALGVTIAVRGTIALFVVRSEEFGLGDAGPGYFYAAVAFGAILGGVIAGAGSHLGRGALRGAAVAMVACALALAAYGAIGAPVGALLALVIAGFATDVYEVLALTYFQHRLPAALYGRFMSIFMLALGIGGIVGALAGPLIEAATTVAVALALLALPGVALALALLVRTAVTTADR